MICLGCNRFVNSDFGRLDNIAVAVYFVNADWYGIIWSGHSYVNYRGTHARITAEHLFRHIPYMLARFEQISST